MTQIYDLRPRRDIALDIAKTLVHRLPLGETGIGVLSLKLGDPLIMLKVARQSNWLTTGDLRELVEHRLVIVGYKCITANRWPDIGNRVDHVSCPPAMAYALKYDPHCAQYKKKVHLDSGVTIDEFMAQADGFLDTVMRQLEQLMDSITVSFRSHPKLSVESEVPTLAELDAVSRTSWHQHHLEARN